jgi:hypothetical protein
MSKKLARSKGTSKLWTSRELADLTANANLGEYGCAELLGRSRCSVRSAAYRSRISLRRPRERRGSVLGQPRGVSLRPELIAGLKADTRLAQLVAQRMRIDASAALCPTCGRRPATVRTTGLCVCCHTERLTEGRLAVLEEIDAHRAYDVAKQKLCRARKAAEPAIVVREQ